MFSYLNKKGQSTAEYVIVLGLIIAVLIAMQTYIKRGFQGRVKNAVDFTDQGEQKTDVVQFSGEQYEPYYMDSSFRRTSNTEENEKMLIGGGVERTTTQDESARSGHQAAELGRASNE